MECPPSLNHILKTSRCLFHLHLPIYEFSCLEVTTLLNLFGPVIACKVCCQFTALMVDLSVNWLEYQNVIYPMDALPSSTSLILVVLMNNLRDMEIARLLGWYRIPLRSAPKVVAVDYLAFYQTAAFGEEKWRIQYVAAVRGHELTTRADLLKDETDHPHAQQPYYKIQIGPLVRLPVPVLAETWRRITFLYTTGEYLLKAHTVNELVVETEERQVLWQALRERGSQSQQYQPGELPELRIDPTALAALLGIKESSEIYTHEHSET
jgi:hypothetical protein